MYTDLFRLILMKERNIQICIYRCKGQAFIIPIKMPMENSQRKFAYLASIHTITNVEGVNRFLMNILIPDSLLTI